MGSAVKELDCWRRAGCSCDRSRVGDSAAGSRLDTKRPRDVAGVIDGVAGAQEYTRRTSRDGTGIIDGVAAAQVYAKPTALHRSACLNVDRQASLDAGSIAVWRILIARRSGAGNGSSWCRHWASACDWGTCGLRLGGDPQRNDGDRYGGRGRKQRACHEAD